MTVKGTTEEFLESVRGNVSIRLIREGQQVALLTADEAVVKITESAL